MQIDAANARYQAAHSSWVEAYESAVHEWETTKVCGGVCAGLDLAYIHLHLQRPRILRACVRVCVFVFI